jgi:N-glycosylase/DNA lyase
MKINLAVKDFNLEATLDSGQVFGFEKQAEAQYVGRIDNEAVHLSQNHDTLQIEGGMLQKSFRNRLQTYFDLNRNLDPVYTFLNEDRAFRHVPNQLKKLRLIRQDSWQALASFIISSNNNVKRIQGIWRNLTFWIGQGGHFPTPLEIAQSHEGLLRQCGLGYRAPFLLRTAQFIAKNPVCLEMIAKSEYEEARLRVLAFPGVGPKVADCILLYGFGRYEAFPVDVWIYRVMKTYYFPKRSTDDAKVHRFAQKKWGAWAGYVQQYLFHAARCGILLAK